MKAIWLILKVLNYLLALLMVYSGVMVMLIPENDTGEYEWLFNNSWAIVVIGFVYFCSGLTLLIGKITQYQPAIGYGLLATYLSFLFTSILNVVEEGFLAGLPNLVASGMVGLLYLRWKHHLFYIDSPRRPREPATVRPSRARRSH